MSRSYARFAVVTDYGQNYTHWAKRQASKKLRRTCAIDDGGSYKKGLRILGYVVYHRFTSVRDPGAPRPSARPGPLDLLCTCLQKHAKYDSDYRCHRNRHQCSDQKVFGECPII